MPGLAEHPELLLELSLGLDELEGPLELLTLGLDELWEPLELLSLGLDEPEGSLLPLEPDEPLLPLELALALEEPDELLLPLELDEPLLEACEELEPLPEVDDPLEPPLPLLPPELELDEELLLLDELLDEPPPEPELDELLLELAMPIKATTPPKNIKHSKTIMVFFLADVSLNHQKHAQTALHVNCGTR